MADSDRRRIAEEGAAPHAHVARARRIFGFVEDVPFSCSLAPNFW